jgi:putative PIN family toxin of toxin-antitoxin system
LKLVLDTNVWLDLLVFDDPAVRALREGAHEIVIDAPCAAELERVLGYPLGRWTLAPERRAACLAACLSMSRSVESGPAPAGLPSCEDPDDQKFLALAAACGADALLTKDEALLKLSGRVPFRVARPADL